MKDTTPSAFKKHWESRVKVLRFILDGLDGKPFNWSTQGETKTYLRLAREMGVTLVTQNQINKIDHKLKAGAKPVGKGNFGGKFAEPRFYVLECQTTETEKAWRLRHETGMTPQKRLMQKAKDGE